MNSTAEKRMNDECCVNVPDCFISDHQGFTGRIKNYTKDFVVTEIDVHRQLVNKRVALEGSQKSDKHDLLKKFNLKRKTNIKSEKANSSPAYLNTDISVHSKEYNDLPSPVKLDLNAILGQSVYDDLQRFVTFKKASDPKREPATKQADPELTLGAFPDKDQRVTIHRAIRQHYPSLMTLTHQSEIKVKENRDYGQLAGMVTEEESEDFFRFIDAKVPGSSYTFRPDESKGHRTAVHHFISHRFGKLVETKTFSDHGKTCITVRLRERAKPRKRTKEDCEEEEVYTAFTLCKENMETLEAINYMAATLGVVPSDFTYAGIKDKRAITYQTMVVKKVSVKRLTEKTAELERRGLRLTQVRSVGEPLRLGQLEGNHFDLVVRDLRAHGASGTPLAEQDAPAGHMATLVEQAVESIKDRGFVNYYGPQRFGTSQSVQSDRVGLALLKEDMVGAVRLFFTPEEGEQPHNQAKRLFLQTDNAKESLALMPPSKARERLMLRALHRYGSGADGCARAWLSLPHSMRVFYPHAYCSRVWNEGVAHRLATLGHTVRQGDLVWLQDVPEDAEGSNVPQIHVVTAEEERDGLYRLAQVLLPMPGNTVKYPENTMGMWYRERLSRDGLENCRFRVASLKLNLPGCYRPLLAFPRNLTYQLQDCAAGEEGEKIAVKTHEEETEALTDDVAPQTRRNLKSPVLILNFDLESSSYATVCLREMMKCDL